MCSKIIVLTCVFFMSIAGSVWAGTQVYTNWTGPEGGDWNTAANWSAGVPVQLDPIGGPQGASFGKAGFKSASNPGPTIVGTVSTDQIIIGGSVAGILTIPSGATVNISEFVNMGNLATEKGMLNMNGGTLNCGVRIPADGYLCVGTAGLSVLNMNSGTINLTSSLKIQNTGTYASYVHLDGGTINATDLVITGANGHMDIRGGTLILDGNDIAAINALGGKLTAYAGTAGGIVQSSYNPTTNKTTVTGFLPTPKAINPVPFNAATNVAANVTLSWMPGLGAISHNVYLDTVNPPVTLAANQTETSYNATVAPATAYYWRVDEINGSGTETGTVWMFTTASGLATNPTPANTTTSDGIHPILSWTPGAAGPLSHDVYFGATSPGTFRGNQLGSTTFDTGLLEPNSTYYWRIDEVYTTGTVTGTVWNFKTPLTKASLQPTPTNPSGWQGDWQFCPPPGFTEMPIIGLRLMWNPGSGAASHDVYFGSANPPAFQGNQSSVGFTIPNVLLPNTTYYWRIDEKDSGGNITQGDVYSFTTGNPVGIYPYLAWRSDPRTSIVVNWYNPAAKGDSSVDYGLTSSYGSTANVATQTNYHHVEITGLEQNTVYHYRIRSSDGTTGTDAAFKTAPDLSTDSFRFCFSGDPRGTMTEDEPYYTRQGALCDWMLAQDFPFTIEGGDTVWEGASLKAIGKWWPDFFRVQGNLTKSKVVMHALGNHEVQGGGNYYYWNDFYTDAYPNTNVDIPGNNGRVYSFDYGTAHLVSLATYQANLTLQANWLRADLTAAKARGAKWIFVYLHAPMYTTSGHANRTDCIQSWGPIFDEFGVTAVFQSHNHLVERFHSLRTFCDNTNPLIPPVWTGVVVPDGEGTVYITNGTGGAEFNNGSSADPKLVTWFGAANPNVTIATVVTINGNTCRVDQVRNDTGAVLDTLELMPRMLKADFNKDGFIDMQDLGTMAGSWLDTGIWP